jgi:hypothetical protein
MLPDMNRMEEVLCPSCQKPLFMVLNPDTNMYTFDGCLCCGREDFTLPEGIRVSIGGGPFFLYKPKSP